MARRRLLVLLKPFDVYPASQSDGLSRITSLQLKHLDNRRKVHKDAINFCQNILRHKPVEWKALLRNDIRQPIHDVDLVITVGGDGTLLHASHYIDDSVPVLGVNSDPTRPEEVLRHSNVYDATRSTGYLCAATVQSLVKSFRYELMRLLCTTSSQTIYLFFELWNRCFVKNQCSSAQGRPSILLANFRTNLLIITLSRYWTTS
ncbi:putative phosphotransferase with an alcohol group as acceptor [Rosa chinensis]|uniref:Putative phosphotransferase with an alcohol group as acceptor n=1 Tax=Rosa chinensis TaxID=74649 RepID=A0A2P6Q9M7_ROSCH|nr:putative phosphotransferase with an alcohol group as acceptor [Rosa chinensis]